MNNRIVLSLTLITLLAACAPAQPPTARAPTALETKLASATDLSPLNNDFDSSIGNLTWLDEAGVTAPAVKDSWLTVRNSASAPIWFSDTSGAMLYAYVSGDFMVESKVTANLCSDITQRSNTTYSSAGLVMRDPTSSPGKMRWVVYNAGFQDGYFGTELKTTRDSAGGFALEAMVTGNNSLSTWFSNKIEGSSNEAQLRICRVGPELRFFIRPTGESAWREETRTASTVRAGSDADVPGLLETGPNRLQRTDLPAMLQVGVMANTSDTTEGRYDHLRFTRIANFENCTK
jgi:regulation of enolase protein 1 (concanavalin A-like superfamily)